MIFAWPCIIYSCPAVYVLALVLFVGAPVGSVLAHLTPDLPVQTPAPIRGNNDAELFTNVWIIQGENAHWLREKMCQSAVSSVSLDILNEKDKCVCVLTYTA